jgi:hypothetical protein
LASRPEIFVHFDQPTLRSGNVNIVQLSDGRLFPDPWTPYVSVDATWMLKLEFVVDEVLEPVLTSLSVYPEDEDHDPNRYPLTQTIIRGLANQRLINAVVRQGCDWAEHDEQIFRHALRSEPPQRQRRRKSDATMPQLLRLVAEIVCKNSDRPTRAVQEQVGVSHRTATRYIALAREQGYLNDEVD